MVMMNKRRERRRGGRKGRRSMRGMITIIIMLIIRRTSRIIIRDRGVITPATHRIFQR